ncbi:SDR family NAD(P)-dependent oxidoreductase [Streptomyces sp. S.PNR 29]|uniref:SDR family NAD(P)-dependent oxidoreductase n=1 Tax=Streptomyces sp. S.PNR 29 TaxID=2973805 RepID=UPI0025B0778D|nr:SDR family NAD(P)-dependent oxidoreductase [Streptomyces sp. S.PNR 29]MDN0195313.1 SDR family NAD(P)-dependent oxidoreductase [Streptomyces sp. S.PNR 29]
MNEKAAVVTGASAGIGAATALELARRGLHVVLIGRDEDRLRAVSRAVDAAGPVRSRWIRADFTRLDDVAEVSRVLHDSYPGIDVLINNAGVYTRRWELTGDGHEVTNQVNHLAPFLLTSLLWDLLDRRAGSRVVTTGSLLAEGLDPDDLDRVRSKRAGWAAYKASKQANALFAVRLAELTGSRGPVPTCCHPGMVRTGFASGSRPYRTFRRALPFLFQPVESAALALVNLATGDDGVRHPGALFNGTKPVKSLKRWRDPGLARRLWTATEDALGSDRLGTMPYGADA